MRVIEMLREWSDEGDELRLATIHVGANGIVMKLITDARSLQISAKWRSGPDVVELLKTGIKQLDEETNGSWFLAGGGK